MQPRQSSRRVLRVTIEESQSTQSMHAHQPHDAALGAQCFADSLLLHEPLAINIDGARSRVSGLVLRCTVTVMQPHWASVRARHRDLLGLVTAATLRGTGRREAVGSRLLPRHVGGTLSWSPWCRYSAMRIRGYSAATHGCNAQTSGWGGCSIGWMQHQGHGQQQHTPSAVSSCFLCARCSCRSHMTMHPWAVIDAPH